MCPLRVWMVVFIFSLCVDGMKINMGGYFSFLSGEYWPHFVRRMERPIPPVYAEFQPVYTIYVSDQTFSGLLYRLVRSLEVSWFSRLAVISFQCSMCFWFSLSSLVSRVAFLNACASWWMAFSIGFSVSFTIHSDCFRSSRWFFAVTAASLASFSCWAISLSFFVSCHGLMPSFAAGCVTRVRCSRCSVSLSSSSIVCWIVWLRM